MNSSQITDVESALGVTFPASYRSLLSTYNVGIPERNQFDAEEIVTSVTHFYGFSDNPVKDLVATNEAYSGRPPVNVCSSCRGSRGKSDLPQFGRRRKHLLVGP